MHRGGKREDASLPCPPGTRGGGGVPPRPSLPCTSGGRQRRGPRAPASAVCTVKTGRGARWKLRSGAGRSPPQRVTLPPRWHRGISAGAGPGPGQAGRPVLGHESRLAPLTIGC